MLITTTSSVEGWEVLDYLGPISAQFVIGTGVFTDFFSSFTDFFGAHSQSYQRKLDRIDQEALALIRTKAARIGANAVLGLRVDHDEISGSGKSMLMVTASGTAVRASRIREEGVRSEPGSARQISAQDLATMIARQETVDRAASGNLEWLDEDHWQFVIENRIEEMAPHLLRHLGWALSSGRDDQRNTASARAREYFLRIEREVAARHLINCIGSPKPLWDFALGVLSEAQLLDIEIAREKLTDEDSTVRQRALQVAMLDLPHYTVEHIASLECLLGAVRDSFPPLEIVVKKGMLGEKEVWNCVNRHDVAANLDRCPACNSDRYGLPHWMPNPSVAGFALERKIGALRNAFDGSGAA